MVNELREVYKTEFRRLYRQGDYQKAFDLVFENQEIERYLSKREKLMMICTCLDRINVKADELEADNKRHKLEMFAIKFGWKHRN